MAFNPEEHFRVLERKDKKTGKVTKNDYLDVKWRILWFREQHPKGSIVTTEVAYAPLPKQGWENSVKSYTDVPGARFMAEVYDGDGKLLARDYASETADDFPEFYEKSSTKSIGRALALAGFGTQFAEELEEDSDVAGSLADSPVEQKAPKAFTPNSDPATAPNHESTKDTGVVKCGDCGAAVDGYKVGSRVITAEEVIRSSTALVGHPLCRQCYALHKTPTATK